MLAFNGGFALGAYWAGVRFEKHYFSEIDVYCNSIYSLRFPTAIPLGDIKKINVETLLENKKEWIITGGFPCQDISIAGKGEGIKGERSGLWFAMFDVIRILRPRFAIIENVGAITHRGLDTVLGCLAEIGYDAEWQNIRASDMGAPHRRERIWIIVYPDRNRFCKQQERIRPKSTEFVRSDIINVCKETSDSPNYRLQGEDQNMADTKCSRRTLYREIQEQRATGRNEKKTFNKCSTRSRPSEWLPEPAVGRLAHGVSRRVDRLKGLGNSIVPQIAELLFRQIKDML